MGEIIIYLFKSFLVSRTLTVYMIMLPPEDAMKRFGVTGEKGVIAFITKK